MRPYQVTFTLKLHSNPRNPAAVTSTKSGNTTVVHASGGDSAKQLVEAQYGGRANVTVTAVRGMY